MSTPTTFISWKSTDACLDIHCPCGAWSHFDGYFFHYFRCAKCGTVYVSPDTVELTVATSVPPDDEPYVKTDPDYDTSAIFAGSET